MDAVRPSSAESTEFGHCVCLYIHLCGDRAYSQDSRDSIVVDWNQWPEVLMKQEVYLFPAPAVRWEGIWMYPHPSLPGGGHGAGSEKRSPSDMKRSASCAVDWPMSRCHNAVGWKRSMQENFRFCLTGRKKFELFGKMGKQKEAIFHFSSTLSRTTTRDTFQGRGHGMEKSKCVNGSWDIAVLGRSFKLDSIQSKQWNSLKTMESITFSWSQRSITTSSAVHVVRLHLSGSCGVSCVFFQLI